MIKVTNIMYKRVRVMTTCPNCNRPITDNDKICPKCHFDLQKYRDTFFTDKHLQANYENDKTGERIASRKLYRQEFYPQKQNLVVQKMLEWLRVNSMIVMLLGITLLILMSFSRSIGWICFFALLVWLYVVCIRSEKIERYTVDRRLTEKVNQIFSNTFNSVANSKRKVIKNRGQQANQEAFSKQHYGYSQLLVILMAVINLIVMFAGSGASISDVTYTGKMSITRVIFRLAGHLFSSGETRLSGVLLCLIWLLIVLIPLSIIYSTLKDNKKRRLLAFSLSLLESIFLIYLIIRLSSISVAGKGLLKNITNEFLLYAVSVGTSTYFLILSSIMTTFLTGYNLIREKLR